MSGVKVYEAVEGEDAFAIQVQRSGARVTRLCLPGITAPLRAKGADSVQRRAQRRVAGRMGAHVSWARTDDRSARTAPARAALMAKFEREVDPEGQLPEEERARRAESARRAHFTRLALKSAAARRR